MYTESATERGFGVHTRYVQHAHPETKPDLNPVLPHIVAKIQPKHDLNPVSTHIVAKIQPKHDLNPVLTHIVAKIQLRPS